MNLLLLFPEDFITETRARVDGRRLAEIERIGSDELRVGIVNGRIGTARMGAPGEVEVRLDRDPPPPLPLTLVLALPRPHVLHRLIAGAPTMGIKRTIRSNAQPARSPCWSSP